MGLFLPIGGFGRVYWKKKVALIVMRREYHYYVYILASQRNGTLYIGISNNVLNRNWQHKQKENGDSFTAKYDVNILVYYETYTNVNTAIAREKQLKNWKREWKIKLIEKDNPVWRDLFADF
jgi:putative endonuclease